jgi:hypothetical protein
MMLFYFHQNSESEDELAEAEGKGRPIEPEGAENLEKQLREKALLSMRKHSRQYDSNEDDE